MGDVKCHHQWRKQPLSPQAMSYTVERPARRCVKCAIGACPPHEFWMGKCKVCGMPDKNP